MVLFGCHQFSSIATNIFSFARNKKTFAVAETQVFCVQMNILCVFGHRQLSTCGGCGAVQNAYKQQTTPFNHNIQVHIVHIYDSFLFLQSLLMEPMEQDSPPSEGLRALIRDIEKEMDRLDENGGADDRSTSSMHSMPTVSQVLSQGSQTPPMPMPTDSSEKPSQPAVCALNASRENRRKVSSLAEGLAFQEDALHFLEESKLFGEDVLGSLRDALSEDSLSTAYSGVESASAATNCNCRALASKLGEPQTRVPLLHMIEWDKDSQQELLLWSKHHEPNCSPCVFGNIASFDRPEVQEVIQSLQATFLHLL